MQTDVDVIRTSASRPLFLRISTESWGERLHFSGDLRWFLHEDVIDKKASDECVSYAKSVGYDDIEVSDPPIGQGYSLSALLKKVETPYVLNVEDDWHLLEDIDLDLVLKVMDENPDINQIAFFKRPLLPKRRDFVKREVVRSGVKLTTDPYWAFTPALWRMSYVRPRWHDERVDVHQRFTQRLLGKRVKPDADWVIANSGTYFMGGIDEGLYVQHLGMHQSRREGSFGPKKQRYPYKHPNLYLGDLFYV